MSYDPTIGRWTAEDPIAFKAGDTNLYRYVGNNPANFTDPSGLAKKARLSVLPDRLRDISDSRDARNEAERIGAAVRNTFDNNWQLTYPRFKDQRVKGYFCYDWAYGFQNAFNGESSGKYFTAEVEEASSGPNVHYWLKIKSIETGKYVYVDDGFSNGDYVHKARPIPTRWEMGNPGDVPKETCSLPRTYGSAMPSELWMYGQPGM